MKIKFKYLTILILIGIVIMSMNSVSSGWFGYDDGECEFFYIDCPNGYHNTGDTERDWSLFLAGPEGEFTVYCIESKDNFTNFDDEEITVEDSIIGDDFEAYKTTTDSNLDVDHNSTYLFYHDGNYEYELKMWRSIYSPTQIQYDGAQFKKDAELLKNVAHSIIRK